MRRTVTSRAHITCTTINGVGLASQNPPIFLPTTAVSGINVQQCIIERLIDQIKHAKSKYYAFRRIFPIDMLNDCELLEIFVFNRDVIFIDCILNKIEDPVKKYIISMLHCNRSASLHRQINNSLDLLNKNKCLTADHLMSFLLKLSHNIQLSHLNNLAAFINTMNMAINIFNRMDELVQSTRLTVEREDEIVESMTFLQFPKFDHLIDPAKRGCLE